jgi:hypothetical protein
MASRRGERRRVCARKVRYATEALAYAARRAMRRKYGRETRLVTAYHCRFCGGYHLGHTPQGVLAAINARARGGD